MVIFTVLKTVS